jgi:hypothetical protein
MLMAVAGAPPPASPMPFLRAWQLDYNILFRWFVGLEMDEPIWAPTVFTKIAIAC